MSFKTYKPSNSHFVNFRYTQGIINSKRFVLKIPLEMGFGSYDSFEKAFWDDNRKNLGRAKLTPIQAGIYTELKLVRHFGIYGKVGSYNFINKENTLNRGIYYRVNIKINTDVIFKDIYKATKYYYYKTKASK